MSSFNSLDALASERQHNANLRKIILAVIGLAGIAVYVAWSLPKHLDLHISPDLKAGDKVAIDNGVAQVPTPNLYSFAYYVWQQVNRWQADGGKDYGNQIFSFQSYLTPSCQAQLQGDLDRRAHSGELSQRTRQVSEIPGYGFQDARVLADGSSAWTVLLDMQVMETYRGQPIKDTFIRYPIRVVRYDVDRERNPFRLALDCFGSNSPVRIDLKDKANRQLTNTSTITPASLPSITEPTLAPQPSHPPSQN